MVFIYFLISLISDIRPPARRGCAPALCAGGDYEKTVPCRGGLFTSPGGIFPRSLEIPGGVTITDHGAIVGPGNPTLPWGISPPRVMASYFLGF